MLHSQSSDSKDSSLASIGLVTDGQDVDGVMTKVETVQLGAVGSL